MKRVTSCRIAATLGSGVAIALASPLAVSPSGAQATGNCKVVVKRGAPTPWGTVAWSTYSSIQRLSARGSGAITFNGWA